MKKLYLSFLTMIYCLSLQAYNFEVDGIYYSITNSTQKTVGVTYLSNSASSNANTYEGAISIPTTVTNNGVSYTVTSVGASAFIGCTKLTSLQLPSTLTSIGNSAFYGCSSLESLTIPASVTLIGTNSYSTSSYTFEGCTGLRTLVFEDGAETLTIGEGYYYGNTSSSNKGMFYDCPLDSVYLGRPVTYPTYNSNYSYYYSPFAKNTQLKSVALGSELTNIGDYLFYDCSALANLDMSRSTELTAIGNYSLYGCSKLSSIDFPTTVKTIGSYAFYNAQSIRQLMIPASTTSIGTYAFYGCSALNTLKLGKSVNTIGDYSFQSCKALKSIDFSESISLKSIGNYAFYGCSSLSSMDVSKCVELATVGSYAFYNCSSIEGLDLSNCQKLTTLSNTLFSGCKGLKWIKLPSTLTSIGNSAFYGCSSLESLTIPASVTLIGTNSYSTSSYTFEGCTGLRTLVFEDGAETLTIGEGYYYGYTSSSNKGMFYDCPLNSVYLGRPVSYPTYSSDYSYYYSPFARNTKINIVIVGGEVNTLQQYLFYGCSNLTTMVLGSNLSSIGQYAIFNCPKLTKVELPEKVKSIGNYAFAGTTVLQDIKCDMLSPISISSNVWSQNTYKGNLSVPVGTVDSYMQTTTWKDFANIAAHTEPIYDFTVDGIYYKIIDLSNRTCEVTYKDEFVNGYMQKSIIIPATVNYNNRTFDVVSIGQRAFDGAILLENLTIPSSAKDISNNAFDHCTSLVELTLPNTIEHMNYNLKELYLKRVNYFGNGNEIKSWLKDNRTVVEVTFDCPNLTHVADSAFYACTSLEKNNLPSTIQNIGDYAFSACKNISNFELPASLKKMGVSAFQSCTSLTSVIFKTPMTEIPSYAYASCTSLSSVVFGERTRRICSNAFSGCSAITELVITNSIDTIADNAFSGCTAVKSLSINDSHKEILIGRNINSGLFSDCPLKKIYIGRDILGETPFDNNKSIERIEIGHQVESFPDPTLANMPQLVYLSLGDKLKVIPSFSTCVNLREITVGSQIRNLPDFSSCLSLRKIIVRSLIPPTVESNFASRVYIDGELFVPQGCLSSYQEANVWKDFWNIYEYTNDEIISLTILCSKYMIKKGETTSLSAKLYPEGEICSDVIWKSTDTNIATVSQDGTVTGINIGTATIIATAVNNTSLSDTCFIKVSAPYELGDVNDDGYVNVADISGVINFIMETNTEDLIFEAADINKDNIILVDDLTDLISMILHPDQQKTNAYRARLNSPNNVNRCNADIMIRMHDNNVIEFILPDEFDQYSGLQFDLALPTGYIVENVVSYVVDDVQSIWSSLSENNYRIMLYSPSNTAFYANAEKTISVKYTAERGNALGSVALCNIVATTPVSNAVYMYDCNFTLDHATSIQSTNVAHGEKAPIYNLAGQRVRYPQTGIYIKDGKKLIRK